MTDAAHLIEMISLLSPGYRIRRETMNKVATIVIAVTVIGFAFAPAFYTYAALA